MTLISGSFEALGEQSLEFLGCRWSLSGFSGVLLYLLGLAGEIVVLSSVHLVTPVGRLPLRQALISGVTAALLWEVMRRGLVWYFATLSQVGLARGPALTWREFASKTIAACACPVLEKAVFRFQYWTPGNRLVAEDL